MCNGISDTCSDRYGLHNIHVIDHISSNNVLGFINRVLFTGVIAQLLDLPFDQFVHYFLLVPSPACRNATYV